ncbi:hypothetical protein P8C59_004791 [Phyllachora maydis]|uniref:Sister chromatid cohesion protein n=1 Tax=Phyllachora maydis TaxID=1825666 RepID=A0AAD9I323_9PEZI|nr:hypothetical protein P8C59_004791 [Phyllachora maydis]
MVQLQLKRLRLSPLDGASDLQSGGSRWFLPYAPFTSVQPFSADLLPTPSIGSAAPAPSLVDLISASDWESINQEVATEARPSKRVQQTAGQITSLLGKISSTEYKFKTGPIGSGNDWAKLTTEDEATLTSLAQAKVHTSLTKAISLSCYSEVPLNDLLRLMRLSGGALKASQSLELKLGEDWGPSDIERWVSQFDELENGMKAARTCLRLMCGGREDKQLYSEDIIERSIDLIRTVLDDMVIPVAEIRSSSQPTGIFKQVSCHKKRISAVLNDFQKLFSLMTILITKTDVSDSVSNALESMSSRLIFIETANSEKESVVETQKFDGLRSAAMDMLSQIFLLNPAQRHYIIGSVLTSLEKLPLGKQRARQFKTVGGPSIQPVSALLMRLVQASAGKYDDSKEVTRARTLQSLETAESIEGSTGEAARATAGLLYTVKDEEQAAARHSDAVAELKDTEERLTKEARTNAHHVSKFLVQRAQQATKTGDTPYRNLLDLFVEDFTSCLDNPDWPAAELLIRHLMILMNITLEDTKASAPAKNMALEILGVIGAAISTLRGNVRKTANGLETLDRDELGDYLCDLAVHALEPQAPREQVMSWSGPYRVALEYLQSRLGQNSHLASASSFLVTDWARQVCDVYDRGVPEAHDDQDAEYGKLAYRLREMILDQQWLLNEYEFRVVNPAQAKLAYSIVLLRSNVCEYYPQILTYLLNSMVSDQATVRSKSLKSINQVLETDPSILDGPSMLNQKSDKQGVIDRILHCLNDSSTQVRDSALGLIGVRKRAMKLARDIYLRNQNKSIRSQIANGLLFRVLDPEESVRELARQLMEEIWFLPYYQAETTAEAQAAFAEHVVLLVQTAIQGGQNTGLVLDKVLSGVLSPSSKNAQSKANMEVCRKLVAGMVDLIGNPDSSDASVASGRDVLQVLTTFAKAEPTLFTYEQIRLLQPQVQSIGSISNSDELAPARAVVVIYRRVLPTLSSAHQEFFVEIRAQLTKVISAAPKPLLDDTMACLWTISTLVGTNENLQRLLQSSLARVQDLHQKVPKQNGRFVLDALQTRQFMRYCLLVGMIGKHCDLEAHLDTLKRNFPKRNFQTISQLMVDMFLPFCSSLQQLDVRKAALEAVGFVCQSWPRNYALPNVYTTMEDVFTRQNPALEMIVLKSFKEFFLVEEKRSEEPEEATAGAEPAKKEKKAKKRELTEMGGTNHDDVASATAVRFLRQITRVALATQDDVALLAVEVLGSINRQGLVHPKESCVTFITLETSSNPRIAELAYAQHVMLLTKHESVLEREYVKAFVSAFQYQRDVGGDAHGATQDPFQSKMHSFIDALKSSASKAKNRQKFLEKFVGQIDFDPVKLDVQEDIPHHVQYARFLVENLAL